MKKSILFAASVCCLIACQAHLEEDYAGGSRIIATLGEEATKTVLSPGQNGVSSILWSEADELAVFLDGKSQAIPFQLTEGAGTKQAVFKGGGSGSSYVAFSPSKMVSSLVGDNVRINLPLEQAYQEGTFANGVYPMLASDSSPNLTFSNLASILRLSITGKHKVTRIVFRPAQSSIKVCGQATASVTNKQLNVTSNGKDSLVLTVPEVQLSQTEPTDFYLVLPPQTYTGGFTVRVYTNERYMDKTLASDFTLVRSQMHKADAFVFQPSGLDVSTSLKGSGTDNDPFLVESLEDLVFLRDAVNAGKSIGDVDAATASYQLTADIDLSLVCSAVSKQSWTPIGTEASPFQGTFNGGNHLVKGLYINSNGNNKGFFGKAQASYICHLQIDGNVTSTGQYTSLVVGSLTGGNVAYCTVSGQVSGRYYTGGVAGQVRNGQINDCVNRSEVKASQAQFVGGVAGDVFLNGPISCVNYGTVTATDGSGDVGGIAGETGGPAGNCVNYGDVTSSDGYHVGGIFGIHQARDMYNCRNYGNVSGRQEVGGITGRSLQQGLIYNCLNEGAVSGTDYVAGICAYQCNEFGDRVATAMMNCLNVGGVSGTGTYVGALCAYNQGADATYGYKACVVEQNYWLYDPDKNLGMEKGVAVNEGNVSSNFALTEAQMKGAAYSAPLYKTCTQVLDALNGWAYDHLSSGSIPLQGWYYPQEGAYPGLNGMDATLPGEEASMFSISPTSFELKMATSGEVQVKVKANMDYSVTCPEWIEKGEIESYATDPYNKIHKFRVSANTGENTRRGEIIFTNEQGTTLKAFVRQAGSYLTAEIGEMMLSEEGKAKRFTLYSSLSWTVTSDATWCIPSPASGTGDAMITVKASPNESESARKALLKVASADGTTVRTISVIQSGKKPDDGGEQPQGDWKLLPFVHQSVAMRFTATWCGWCPRMNRTIKRAQELYPGHIQHIALHGGGSDLQFNKNSELQTQYGGIYSFPTGLLDGRMLVSNGEIESTALQIVGIVKETEATYGTVSGVEITSSVTGNKVDVKADVYLKKSGDYKITVLLLEDGIMNAQEDNEEGYNPRYIHDCVARMALTDVLGQAFRTSEDYTVKQFNFSATVPTQYNVDNMRVMVYIQRTFGSDKVIQTDAAYGRYFIDNCATATVGTHLKLALEGGSGGGGGGGADGSGNGNEGINPGGEIDM
jgi:thiol-disulfide isomerase/thioredoxin